jgi:hypothetical protein
MHRKTSSNAGRANVVVLLITVFVLLVGTEIVLRIFYHPENLGTVIQFDPIVGWSLKPGSMLISDDPERGLHYRIDVNSIGLRDHEIAMPKPPGKKRILVIGDSVAFGSGVEARDRFSDVLQAVMPEGVEVINGSVPGWGNDQELLFYEHYLRRLDPDLVILQFTGGNDVVNNELRGPLIEEGSKPRFRCVADSLVLEPMVIPAPVHLSPAMRVRALLRHSRLLVFVKRRLEMRAYKKRSQEAPPPGDAGFEADRRLSHWSVYDTRGGAAIEAGWDATECIINRFAQDCRADSSAFLVFAFPLKLEVDVPWRDELMRHTGVDPSVMDFTLPYRRLENFCAERDIHYLYPLDRFQAAAETDTLYFDRDSHPNARGHTLAAACLFDTVVSLLPR